MGKNIQLTHRTATQEDVPALIALMQASIEVNMKPFLSESEIEAAKETMGVDKTLLQDKTYFVIETRVDGQTVIIGCGGWGKRRTLYGGDHTKGRDDSLSDPITEPARIRAMYTHPDWTRCGVGAYLINLGESEARKAGFKSIELGSTLAGEPLYLKCGFEEVSREVQIGENGSDNTIIKMRKSL
ncbi:GNAT family N-acetyltransferase [Aliikangiella marina]|uniref:GNAT family N-acetyltransferase n=1 Tax=Aliikangiella marina TaxID=1712262 RepID=A0A545TJ60_9GAMM|nr:GNAT family N-acetyltransferase [Aliikangiella marina]TQV77269.1 GNAT family N-acetyltransferase [Aliikangiella marina]